MFLTRKKNGHSNNSQVQQVELQSDTYDKSCHVPQVLSKHNHGHVNVGSKNVTKIHNVDTLKPQHRQPQSVNTVITDNVSDIEFASFGNNRFWPLMHVKDNTVEKRDKFKLSDNKNFTENSCPTDRILHQGEGSATGNVRSIVSCNQIHSGTAMSHSVNKSKPQKSQSNGDVKKHHKPNMTTLAAKPHNSTKVSANPGLGQENHKLIGDAIIAGYQCDSANSLTDKYDLDLGFPHKYKARLSMADDSKIFQVWKAQTVGGYGFIPLGDLILPETVNITPSLGDPISDHKYIKKRAVHNYMGPQLEIQSQLNPDTWDKYLQGYWDTQLTLLLRCGFPLDCNKNSLLKTNDMNHKSATDFINHVHTYLKEEQDFGAIIGPFKEPPIEELQVSPFMTREKPDSCKRRVIIDLSYPIGASVNTWVDKDTYLGTDFILTLPSIDHITNHISKLGKGSKIFKIDISRAFRHVKIDPADYHLLGLRLENYFIDTCLPMGFRHGSAIFQRLGDAIRFIMERVS